MKCSYEFLLTSFLDPFLFLFKIVLLNYIFISYILKKKRHLFLFHLIFIVKKMFFS